jgi:hypothetical protein
MYLGYQKGFLFWGQKLLPAPRSLFKFRIFEYTPLLKIINRFMNVKLHAVLTILSSLIIFSCKSPSNMGTMKNGPNGTIVSGTTTLKCTPPQKTYAKGLDAKVKLSMDSLSTIPIKDLEAGLTQTIVHLSDYSSDGLDMDLIMFRICEMSNNRGMTAEQTQTLVSQAIAQWNVTQEIKKKSDSLNKTMKNATKPSSN